MNKTIHTFKHIIDKKGFDYDQITESIFVGSNMCCQYGFSEELLSKNVTADISLEKDRVDNPYGVDYFLWLPTEDQYAPTINQLKLGVKTMDFFVKSNIKFYVHCKNGHGRAPTLVAAYFITSGLSIEEAIDLLKQKRPSTHINEAQIKALRDFQNTISG